jgi:hypothetical protein
MNSNETINIHVNLIANNCFSDEKCALCGELFSPHAAVAELEYWWQGPRTFGYVCDDCLAAGPVGAAERVREYAKNLRKCAEGKDQLAAYLVITPEINWKTTAELREADKKLEAERRQAANNRKLGISNRPIDTGAPF